MVYLPIYGQKACLYKKKKAPPDSIRGRPGSLENKCSYLAATQYVMAHNGASFSVLYWATPL